jgi:hypothetical protein
MCRVLSKAEVEEEVWRVLDGCIRRLESPLNVAAGSGPEAQVARLLDSMIAAVRSMSPCFKARFHWTPVISVGVFSHSRFIKIFLCVLVELDITLAV